MQDLNTRGIPPALVGEIAVSRAIKRGDWRAHASQTHSFVRVVIVAAGNLEWGVPTLGGGTPVNRPCGLRFKWGDNTGTARLWC